MSKTSVVRARIEPALKKEAEKVFAQLGLTTSEAIHLLYRQVSLTRLLRLAALRHHLQAHPEAVT